MPVIRLEHLAQPLAGLSAAAEARLGRWLMLAIRLWLAQAFLAAQMHDMMTGSGLAAAFQRGWWSDVLHQVMASQLGLAIQTVCPLLLALGLLCRAAAAAMLLQAVLTVVPGMGAETQLLCAALLLRVMVVGPEALSLDGVLRRGAQSLAVPGVAALQRGFGRVSRVGGPLYQLALRLALAAALAWPAAARMGMLPGGVAEWLPLPALLAAGVALVAGAGVRFVVLGLLAVIALQAAGTGGAGPYWALLLAVMVLHGAGRWSVDSWLAGRLRRMAPAANLSALPHVVVVGGGFGGIAAVRGLHNAPCRVTLIDQRNHHLFQPLLYQVATAGLSPGDIAVPIRSMLREQANARVLLAKVTGIDVAAGTVLLDRGAVRFDHLVLATGAQHGYFGRDEWAPFAPGLKTVEDATAIRRRLLLAFEEAENAAGEDERSSWLTFVIVGGGPTGVELAGAIAELARHGFVQEFREIDPASARVVLVEAGPRLLAAFPETLSREAERALRHLGVEVWLDRRVEAVSAEAVQVSGQKLAARTVLWAAGVMASPAAQWLGVTPDRAGRVVVGPDLSVPGLDNVFALGDTAASLAWAGRPVPGLAPAAKQGGAYVARVIRARLLRRSPPGPFRYRHLGSLATIGRQAAVADFGALRLRGALAWWLWGAAHVTFLVGGRNRVTVLLEWLWAYLTFRRGTRLITEDR